MMSQLDNKNTNLSVSFKISKVGRIVYANTDDNDADAAAAATCV